jgi:hypothetical protein
MQPNAGRVFVRGVLAGSFFAALLGVLGSARAEETGFDPIVIEELSAPNTVGLVNDPTGSAPAAKVYSFEIPTGYCNPKPYDAAHGDRDNDCRQQSVRSQMWENVFATKKNANGQPRESWYSFALFIPDDYPYGTRQTYGLNSLFYFHNGECAHLALVDFAGRDDALYLAFSNAALGGHECSPGARLKVADFKDLVGHWSRFEMFVRWAKDPSGEAKVWVDGKLVTEWNGVTLTPGLESINYMKFGLYLCCTGDVARVKDARLFYASIKRADSREGLYTDADRVALVQLQTKLNALGCSVGAANGRPSELTRRMALGCRQFSAGVMPSDLNVGTVRSILALYSTPEASALPRGLFAEPAKEVALVSNSRSGELPPNLLAPVFRVHVVEGQAQKGGGSDTYVSTLTVKPDKQAGIGAFDLEVVVHGDTAESIYKLEIFLQAPTKSAAKVADCGPGTIKFPDRSDHVAFQIDHHGDDFSFRNTECLAKGLPDKEARIVRFVAGHFTDIAVGMVADGTLKLMQYDVLKGLLGKIAVGEVRITDG